MISTCGKFRLGGVQYARPELIAGLAELAALGAEADGDAAEAAAWLAGQLAGMPQARRRRRDAAIIALRRALCATDSDNRAADIIASSLNRFAARLRRQGAARSFVAPPETGIDRMRREAVEAANGKVPGQRSIRTILAQDRLLAKQMMLSLPTGSEKIAQWKRI